MESRTIGNSSTKSLHPFTSSCPRKKRYQSPRTGHESEIPKNERHPNTIEKHHNDLAASGSDRQMWNRRGGSSRSSGSPGAPWGGEEESHDQKGSAETASQLSFESESGSLSRRVDPVPALRGLLMVSNIPTEELIITGSSRPQIQMCWGSEAVSGQRTSA